MFNRSSGARIGDAAPPFVLRDQQGQPVKLVDFRGRARVVVAFYPEADTPG